MALSALALFVVSLGYGVVVPLLPQLLGAQGAPSANASGAPAISIVYALYAAAKISAQVPGGAWVDAAGGQRVLRVALWLFCLSLPGFLFPLGVAWFALVRALEGAATGLVYPAVFALVLQSTGEARAGRRIGAVVGLGTSGLLVGPALGGWLGAREGLPHFLAAGRLPVLVALCAALAIAVWAQLGEKVLPEAGAAQPRPPARTVAAELRTLWGLARDPGFLGLCLPIAFNKLTFSAFQGLLPLHGAALGLGPRGVTLLFALTGIIFGAAQGLGGVLVDRFAPRTVALWLTPPLLLSLCGAALAQAPVPFGVYYGAYIAASSVIFTATLKHTARAYGTDDTYGGVFGVLGTLTDLMTVFGPLLFLNLYPAQGAWVFASMALCGLPFAVGFVVLSRRSPGASTGPV
jgi:hypothetical protein